MGEITTAGVYMLAVANCDTGPINVKGKIQVKGLGGYLSPLDSNRLAFYASLLLASTLVLLIWLGVFLPKWGSLYSFQKDLGIVAGASVIECAACYMLLSSWNKGTAPEGLQWLNVIDGLTAVKLSTFAKAIIDVKVENDKSRMEEGSEPPWFHTVGGEVLTLFFFMATFEFRRWVGSRHMYDLEFMGGALRGGFALLFGAVMVWSAGSNLKEQAEDAKDASKEELNVAVVKLNTLVKVVACVGVLGVVLTLSDWTIQADNPSRWASHFQIDGVLQVPYMLALIFVFCAWWPNDALQGNGYTAADTAETQPLGAPSAMWDEDDEDVFLQTDDTQDR